MVGPNRIRDLTDLNLGTLYALVLSIKSMQLSVDKQGSLKMSQSNNALQLVGVDGQVIQTGTQLVAVPKKISFTQDEAHVSKSDKFVPICPKFGQELLLERGYKLMSLNSGRARKLENSAHQTTVATYQHETALKVGDIFPRITLKIPHLYGAVQAYAAFLRLACLNGMAYALNTTERTKIRHTGDAMSQFVSTIDLLVSHTEEMNDSIREMQARTVSPTQVADFVREAARLRLGTAENISSIQYNDLLTVRRTQDTGSDAFTILNIVQENLMRFQLRYQTTNVDEQGRTNLRNMTARPITRSRQGEIETVRSVDLNVSLVDAAKKILMAA